MSLLTRSARVGVDEQTSSCPGQCRFGKWTRRFLHVVAKLRAARFLSCRCSACVRGYNTRSKQLQRTAEMGRHLYLSHMVCPPPPRQRHGDAYVSHVGGVGFTSGRGLGESNTTRQPPYLSGLHARTHSMVESTGWKNPSTKLKSWYAFRSTGRARLSYTYLFSFHGLRPGFRPA